MKQRKITYINTQWHKIMHINAQYFIAYNNTLQNEIKKDNIYNNTK